MRAEISHDSFFKMAAEVGRSLEEEASKRKEKLLAMRQKSAGDGKQEAEVSPVYFYVL